MPGLGRLSRGNDLIESGVSQIARLL